jgi:transcriptional regulator with XRE-family HTH domain
MARNLRERFGYRLKRRRMACGLSQQDLAARVGMPQVHVSLLERGRFTTVNLERLVAIAQVLQTTTDYLLGLSNDQGPLAVVDEDEPVEVGV